MISLKAFFKITVFLFYALEINANYFTDDLYSIAVDSSGNVFLKGHKEKGIKEREWEKVSKVEVEKYSEAYLPERFSLRWGKRTELLLNLKHRGLYRSYDMGRVWENIPSTLKREVDFDKKAKRKITSIDPIHKFLLHKHNILYRRGGSKFIEVSHNLSKTEYFTAILSTKDHIYLGTSTNGLYKASFPQKKKKIFFRKFSKGLPFIPHNQNVNFYEEIQSIHRSVKGDLYVGTGIQGGLYVLKKGKSVFKFISLLFPKEEILDIYQITSSRDGKILWLSTSMGLFILRERPLHKDGYHIKHISLEEILNTGLKEISILMIAHSKIKSLYAWFRRPPFLNDASKRNRIHSASFKKLFYSSGSDWKNKYSHIKKIFKRNIYNGIVIDVKDDFGYIRYPSKVLFANRIGSVKPTYDLTELVQLAHQNNQWVTARIVVFKDPVLFKVPGYAILNKITRKPWIGNQRERWVDPYNQFLAQEYYVPLVKELENLNVDEIQLDYIRFPSDGDVWNTKYSHKKSLSIYSSEALENFLYKVRLATELPISLDIYGYNGIYKAPGLIGQDIESYGRHSDIVAPMLYSSHFGDSYLTHLAKRDRTYSLLLHCAKRYQHLAKGSFIVRPWLQAFPMKTAIWGYGEKYFLDQVYAIQKEKTNGFMFWGAMTHILKAEKALEKISNPLPGKN